MAISGLQLRCKRHAIVYIVCFPPTCGIILPQHVEASPFEWFHSSSMDDAFPWFHILRVVFTIDNSYILLYNVATPWSRTSRM